MGINISSNLIFSSKAGNRSSSLREVTKSLTRLYKQSSKTIPSCVNCYGMGSEVENRTVPLKWWFQNTICSSVFALRLNCNQLLQGLSFKALMAPSSIGQDKRFSFSKERFDSARGHHAAMPLLICVNTDFVSFNYHRLRIRRAILMPQICGLRKRYIRSEVKLTNRICCPMTYKQQHLWLRRSVGQNPRLSLQRSPVRAWSESP